MQALRSVKALILLLSLVGLSCARAQTFPGLDESVARGDFGQLKAVLVSRHGEILFENYYRGASPSDLRQVQSVTKSIGSALIGIAHRQGRIALDDTLVQFFGDLYPMDSGAYRDKAGITVEQVLQQRHGIQWDEARVDYRDPANPVQQMVQSGDWYQYVLTRPTDAPPGTRFSYSTGVSTLMSRMIRVATGMSPEAFAAEALFAPLGIGQHHWEAYSEGGLGTGLTDWPNPDGDPPLGFGLWLRARDLLTLGELYLNGGVHDGQRILDAEWVEASWVKYSHSGNSDFFTAPGWGHGYQWWIARVADTRARTWEVFFASGWGSQVIFVAPELHLVVVTSADNYDHGGADVDALLVTRLLPALDPWLDARFNGAWYDPATDGQGLTLEVRGDGVTVVGFWYTYDDGGAQRWFVLQGQVVDGEGRVTIYSTEGGVFLQGNPVSLVEWGSGTFSASDCDHLDFEFESDERSASMPLTRLSGHCYSAPE